MKRHQKTTGEDSPSGRTYIKHNVWRKRIAPVLEVESLNGKSLGGTDEEGKRQNPMEAESKELSLSYRLVKSLWILCRPNGERPPNDQLM